jgi:hypothetical protein
MQNVTERRCNCERKGERKLFAKKAERKNKNQMQLGENIFICKNGKWREQRREDLLFARGKIIFKRAGGNNLNSPI